MTEPNIKNQNILDDVKLKKKIGNVKIKKSSKNDMNQAMTKTNR